MAKLHITNVILSYPNLYRPKAGQPGQEEKFSASFILPKDHPDLPKVNQAFMEGANARWGEKALETLKALKAADRLCLHDGDAKADKQGYAGNLYLNASSKANTPPLVIGGGPDGRSKVAETEGKMYSGARVNVILDVWAQDNQFGKRVNATLLGVQFVADGPRLSGGAVASMDDFAPIPQAGAASPAASGAAALF